tara:strand:- start:104 stop:448 length:345 start_codon:yes stop_codon:yes gene_type:complete
MTEKLIDPQAAVDFMIAKSRAYAQAEGNKTYMEELRKTIKAEQMIEAETMGHKTAAMQEREAYASPAYKQHLLALQQAVEVREELRWMLIAAQARIEVWRSQSANERAEGRATL